MYYQKQQKTNQKEQTLKTYQKLNKMMMKKVKVMNKMMMNKMKNIEQQPIKSNQLCCGEMICGNVNIDDSSINNNTTIKQYFNDK